MTMELCWLIDTGVGSVKLCLQSAFCLCCHMAERWKDERESKGIAPIQEGDNCCLQQYPWLHTVTMEYTTRLLEGTSIPTTNLESFPFFTHTHDLLIPGNETELLAYFAACSVCYVIHSNQGVCAMPLRNLFLLILLLQLDGLMCG